MPKGEKPASHETTEQYLSKQAGLHEVADHYRDAVRDTDHYAATHDNPNPEGQEWAKETYEKEAKKADAVRKARIRQKLEVNTDADDQVIKDYPYYINSKEFKTDEDQGENPDEQAVA